ncbi:MAG: hypothetical protein LBT10_08010 [Methanobrevibacter sp.]|jgi:hypothetical protein|nr:hypothetical protein [Methanobrevibacter sp.]
MTQDCDLEQDFNYREKSHKSRHYIPSILICPAYLAIKLKKGNHLENLSILFEEKQQTEYEKINFQELGKNLWDPIKNNNNVRYHLLKEFEINDSLKVPELIVDFKHYFTIYRDELYSKVNTNYFASLDPLFREQLSQRFAYYLSRIGLPNKTNNEQIGSCPNPTSYIEQKEY